MSGTVEYIKKSTELVQQLVKEEGLKYKVYRCPAGKLTIGVGRNLEDRGISKKEAIFLLENDIEYFRTQCTRNIACFQFMSPQRQNILIDMMFNLGVSGLMNFTKFLKALSSEDYDQAAVEMLDSKWCEQVKGRAKKLAVMMKENLWFSEI